MEIILRTFQFIMKILYIVVYPVLQYLRPRQRQQYLPPITDEILALSLTEVARLMRFGKVTSKFLVQTYIDRIKEVNPYINAVVEDRFEEALKDAEDYDEIRKSCSTMNIPYLYSRYPLLGIPFTVKESCSVQSMSHVVGSLKRVGMKAKFHCQPVLNLIDAGAIVLVVSATPEYCFSIETNTLTQGRCLNPYDYKRSCGGSSGGEAALQGSGASLFGIGSDIAGSIRIPCLFNGIFGHKPTGGLIFNCGHFPNSSEAKCAEYLQMGPMTRFARDLAILTQIAIGRDAEILNLAMPLDTLKLKIFYSFGFDGLNGFLHHSVTSDIKNAISRAVEYFKATGIYTQRAKIKNFRNSTEIAMSGLVRLRRFPFLMTDRFEPPATVKQNLKELWASICGRSKYTKEGLIFELLRTSNAFMPKKNLRKYKAEARKLRQEIIELLGTDGVLFFPTFCVPAIHHNSSVFPLWAIDYCLLFNILGLPCTHVPMGVSANGIPTGFQIIAAPYQDRLCLSMAEQIENAFGGWVPPMTYIAELSTLRQSAVDNVDS